VTRPLRATGRGHPGRAGHGVPVRGDGEIVDGEPALDRALHRPGLDHRLVPGLADRLPQFSRAVGRVAIPGQRLVAGAVTSYSAVIVAGCLGGEELPGHCRVGVSSPLAWVSSSSVMMPVSGSAAT